MQIPDVAAWKGTTLRRGATAPRQARQMIELWLQDSHPVLRSNVVLAASELVTNAIQHVPAGERREWVKVRIGLGDGFVRLEVTDPGTSQPKPRFAPLQLHSMAQSGRGLGLVAVLSVRRGTHRLGCGHRVVWADLAGGGGDDGPAQTWVSSISMERIARYGKFVAKDGQGQELAVLLLGAAGALENERGCELYLINRQTDAPDTVWVTELWRSKADLDAALKQVAGSSEVSAALRLVRSAETIGLDLLGGAGLASAS
ncbi:ATP-binding protein [Nonomuraea insulae]|uniref:ATP-binding protein n=1 Tax=Nonomuraea insulae TaxID=1616787 RepID=A0ABW1CL80_9ACTN